MDSCNNFVVTMRHNSIFSGILKIQLMQLAFLTSCDTSLKETSSQRIELLFALTHGTILRTALTYRTRDIYSVANPH
jgi:hypothetical protein